MKRRCFALLMALALCFALALQAAGAETPRLQDGAGLLTKREEADLGRELDRISVEYGVEVLVVTLDTIGNSYMDRYTEAFFDERFGRDTDGVMLLVAMWEREYRILSNGLGAQAVSDGEIDAMSDEIAPLLSAGAYAEAFQTFAGACEYQIAGEINGFPFPLGRNLLIAAAIGIVAALIAVGIMAAQLRSVRQKQAAGEYVRAGSFHLTHSSDLYLYRNVSRRRRQTDSGHHSSGHRSGGGSRHMGGGRF